MLINLLYTYIHETKENMELFTVSQLFRGIEPAALECCGYTQ